MPVPMRPILQGDVADERIVMAAGYWGRAADADTRSDGSAEHDLGTGVLWHPDLVGVRRLLGPLGLRPVDGAMEVEVTTDPLSRSRSLATSSLAKGDPA